MAQCSSKFLAFKYNILLGYYYGTDICLGEQLQTISYRGSKIQCAIGKFSLRHNLFVFDGFIHKGLCLQQKLQARHYHCRHYRCGHYHFIIFGVNAK